MGRLKFQWTNTSDENSQQIYLRFSRDYYLSYQLEWDRPLDKNVTDVHIIITGKSCADPDKVGPGCGSHESITKIEAGKVYENTVDSAKTHYYYFPSTEQYDMAMALLTRNITTDHIILFSRVAGYPVFENKAPVNGSFDKKGSDDPSNSSINLAYPKPEIYWFVIASDDSNNVKYSFVFHTGKVASVGDVNATTPQFGSTIDNNTIAYAATKGGVSFTYFTFNQKALKFGIASEDSSDGAPDVFVDINFIPSADSNLVANTNNSEEAHLVAVTTEAQSGFFWYTFRADAQAVDTNWLVAVNSTNGFVIWDASVSSCAKNCSKRGTCDETTGVCICDDTYERYDCNDKVFPLVWIILIAIGGAILLAIAIGVPVSCYVKNKKKSGYERV
jgi:hypothetical protein